MTFEFDPYSITMLCLAGTILVGAILAMVVPR